MHRTDCLAAALNTCASDIFLPLTPPPWSSASSVLDCTDLHTQPTPIHVVNTYQLLLPMRRQLPSGLICCLPPSTDAHVFPAADCPLFLFRTPTTACPSSCTADHPTRCLCHFSLAPNSLTPSAQLAAPHLESSSSSHNSPCITSTAPKGFKACASVCCIPSCLTSSRGTDASSTAGRTSDCHSARLGSLAQRPARRAGLGLGQVVQG